MKRLISTALALVCALTLPGLTASIPARALVPDNTNAYTSAVQTAGINNVSQDQADMLKALGLFLGTGKGFELRKRLDRAEAAVLTVRVMGEEKNVLSQKNRHPFTDVPAWADPHVGWLYRHGLIGGVSKTLYGSTRFVTYREFATLLCLAATGEEDYVGHGIGTAYEQHSIDREGNYPPEDTSLYRDEVVSLLTRFLGVPHTRDARPARPGKPAGPVITVAQFLTQKGVFTAEQFVKAGVKVYPIHYLNTGEGALTAAMLGVPFAESELTGLMGSTPPTPKPYIYAWKYDGGELILYQMDCLTLQASETGRFAWPDAETINITQYGDVAGREYLGAANTTGGAKLICVDGKTVSVPAEGDALGEHWDSYFDPPEDSPYTDHWLTVMLDDTAHVISPDGVTARALEPGVTLVGVDFNGTAVHYREENGFGVIEGVRLTDWTAVGDYRVDLSDPRINPEEPLIAYRRRKYDEYTGFDLYGKSFYGEAGFFFTSYTDGRFTRLTDRPVLDVTGLRLSAGTGATAILSHEPGETYGRTIYEYVDSSATGQEGYVEWELLSALDPPHGIDITDIYGVDSALFFYARKPVGMGLYDVFDYVSWYNAEEGHSGIYVRSFTPGRPEISFAGHDEEWYVQQEQERLDKLGYNWT